MPLASRRALVLSAAIAFGVLGAFTGACSGADTTAGLGASDASGSSDGNGSGLSDSGFSTTSDSGLGSHADSGQSTDAGGGDGGCVGCARDWNQFPAVVQLDGVAEIWVLSDAHGDYTTLTTLLAGAKVISAIPASPSTVEWNAGNATLVIVGDLIDKGPDAPDVVRLVIALRTAAAAAGGHVIATMGNHEAEFLANPENDKATSSDGLDPELSAIGDTPDATASGLNDIGAFIRAMPIAARVDDWFFVHAGKTDGRTIATLTSDLQTGIDTGGFGADVLSAPDSLLEARVSGGAPLWWDATNDAQSLLANWNTALGTKHLVMGHQPSAVTFADGTKRAADEMIQKYGALLFMVDTGMSVDVDDTGGSLLHVTNAGTATMSFEQVLPSGKSKSL